MSSNLDADSGNVNPVFAGDTKNALTHTLPEDVIASDKDFAKTDYGSRKEFDPFEKTPTNNENLTLHSSSIQSIEDEFEDDNDEMPNGCSRQMIKLETGLKELWSKLKSPIKRIFLGICLLAYAAYFVYAMIYRFGDEGSIRLLWVTCLVIVTLFTSTMQDYFGSQIDKKLAPLIDFVKRNSLKINTFCLSCIFVTFVVVIIVDLTIHKSPLYNLVSLSGIAIFIFLCFFSSIHPSKIKWRTVAWGFALQALMAILVLRLKGGFMVFKWLGDRLFEYLEYMNASSFFMFGPSYMDHFKVMKLLPTVAFVSCTISILFYLGIMQWFIFKLAKVMEMTMNTTAGESFSVAANIFLGQIESSIILKPIIAQMTMSEIHAIMTGGFATVAGSVMAAYILFGVPANHLLSASVMSAPAALAISKISYPEKKKSKTFVKDLKKVLGKSPDNNIIEAASSGAVASISLIANIIVHLIAFIALLEFFNATFTWFGDRVGSPVPITFELICSYILWPFAFVMGVSMEDCRKVAELIGIKVFVNEFVAFQQLGVMITNRGFFDSHISKNGSWQNTNFGNDIVLYNYTENNSMTLIKGIIKDRSMVISTYALCGFSNFASLGIQLGALSVMVPNRKAAFSKLAFRTMICGNVACFVTACIAGVFYRPI